MPKSSDNEAVRLAIKYRAAITKAKEFLDAACALYANDWNGQEVVRARDVLKDALERT